MKYSNLNLETQIAYHIFDRLRMLIMLSDLESWKDALGRTILAWLAFDQDPRLVRAIESCLFRYQYQTKYHLLRHPGYKEESSRDHWSYFILFKKLRDTDEAFKDFIKDVPRMRGMNYWMKTLGGSKFHEWMYYNLYIPGARIGNCWNGCIRGLGDAQPERSYEWWCRTKWVDSNGWTMTNGHYLQLNLSRRQKFWLRGRRIKLFGKLRKIQFLIPTYPIHNRGWQLYVMPESRRKDKLIRILSKRFGESNLLLRLLYDLPVTIEEVLEYFGMTGFPSGANLDETCDRDIRRLTEQEAEYNVYEVALIIMLLIRQHKKRSNVC